jgi:putative oxidoreductase
MRPILGSLSEPIYALLRIVAGFLFWCHGAQKLLGMFPGPNGPMHVHGLFLAAGIIELVCGTLIVIGLLASPAAFLAAGEMACAYFIAHFPHGFLPIRNMGEPPVLNCFIFLYIAARGAGTLSVDAIIGKK